MIKENAFLKFLLSCVLLGVVCLTTAFLVQKCALPAKSFKGVYCIIPFVVLVTIAVHYVLIKASLSNPRTFIGKYVAFSGLKLIVYLVAILFYVFVVKSEVVIFMLSFLITYFIFLIFEISAILKFLKKSGL